MLSEDRADRYWRRQYAQAEAASEPLTAREVELLRLQRANPGPLLPELAQLQLARAREEQQRLDQAESYDQAFAVQDRLSNPDPTVLARRGRQSRRLNRHLAADPHRAILRPGPGRSGPPSWNDEPECIDKDAIGWR